MTGARMSRRHSAAALTLVFALAVAACGSTVHTGSTAELAAGPAAPGATTDAAALANSGLGVAPSPGTTAARPGAAAAPVAGSARPAATPAPGGQGGGAVPVAPGPVTSAPNASADQPGSPAPVTPPPAAAPSGLLPANGAPGVTDDIVTMGAVIVRGFDTVVDMFDLQGVEIGDTRSQVEAMVAEVNAGGGIAGRELAVLFHEVDITQETNISAQAICEDFTNDRPVYLVLNIIFPEDPDLLYGCLTEAGVPALGGSSGLGDENFYGRYPHTLYEPGAMNLTRTMRVTINHLHATGWFGDAPTIGVVAYDTQEDHDVVANGIEPTLAALGLPAPKATRYVTQDESGPGMYQSAILEFRSQGVTHVLFTWSSVFLFSQAAESSPIARAMRSTRH